MPVRAMTPFRRLAHWLRYERLQHYPALADLPPEDAMRRLQAYQREELRACRPWLTTVWILIALLFVVWALLALYHPVANGLMVLVQAPGWVLQYVLYRRVRRRVEAKVAAEKRDGRLWTCVECGYDLRASEDRCPECGMSVWVTPPRAR